MLTMLTIIPCVRSSSHWLVKSCHLIMLLACGLRGQALPWELPPTRYSETPASDPLAKLAEGLANGSRRIEGRTELERLRFILRELRVPEESQVLVFSKTSHQNPLIHPLNPRCLYFSEDAYVGYVPGGIIEAVVQDPVLGPVFYLIDAGSSGGRVIVIERDTTNCIQCHGTGRTEHVPGVFVRSVFPDADGHPLLSLGSHDVTHETPLPQRWGGYYVTGSSSLPHLGNRTYREGEEPSPEIHHLGDLRGILDTGRYLRPTSDIVALMVLEHQCRMHNLLTSATMQYRRAFHLARAFDPAADPDEGSAGRVAASAADKITACVLFANEADPGDGLAGDEAFQKAFGSRHPRATSGDSLADFRLHGRLFKFPCSYMIYSSAFEGLPDTVKSLVLERMREALDGRGPHGGRIQASTRARIRAILEETWPAWTR
jgi:hypothetical protein